MNSNFSLGAAVVFNVVAQLLMKSNAVSSVHMLSFRFLTVKILSAIVVYAMSFLCMALALRDLPLSVAAPVSGGAAFLLISLLSVPLFGEQFSLLKLLGLCFLAFGMFLVSR